jgi:hypothetical protein
MSDAALDQALPDALEKVVQKNLATGNGGDRYENGEQGSSV